MDEAYITGEPDLDNEQIVPIEPISLSNKRELMTWFVEFAKSAVFHKGSYIPLEDGSIMWYDLKEVVFAQINF